MTFILFILSFTSSAHASEWAKNEGYWGKTGGKFVFGLKYIIFSFFEPFLESNEPEYKREWEGFCVGIGKAVVYEATGMIQLVTFPIPVDLPDAGIGIHLPNKDCPLRHDPNWKPRKPDSKKDLTLVPQKKEEKPSPKIDPPPASPVLAPAAPKPVEPLIVEAKAPVTSANPTEDGEEEKSQEESEISQPTEPSSK